jgi:hypothetical protein
MTAPKEVEDRVERALSDATVPSRGRWGASLRLAGLGSVASLAIVVAAVLISNGLPNAIPSSTGAPGSPQQTAIGGTTTEAPHGAFPSTIFGIDVLSVSQAIEIRNRPDEAVAGQEIAVAGWYQLPPAMFCPLSMPNSPPVEPLEGGCTIASQWMLSSPESLAHSTTNGGTFQSPAHLAFNVVFDGVDLSWVSPYPSVGNSIPNAIIFIGHFNDARAANCGATDRVACRQRFVVDQVPWVDGAAHDAAFPAEVEGIPVWSVEEALRHRDAGETHGIAVAIGGWYAESVPMARACVLMLAHWGYLERYCHTGQEILADLRQEVGIAAEPVGTALGPILSPDWGSNFLSDRQFPQRVVFIGHFDDPLATDCPHLGAAVCREIFIVDQLAWSSGDTQGIRFGDAGHPIASGSPGTAAAAVTAVAMFMGSEPVVLATTLLEVRDVAGIDPTARVAGAPNEAVWYVRAVEPATHRIGSFVVDQASQAILWSAFPMPTVGAP